MRFFRLGVGSALAPSARQASTFTKWNVTLARDRDKQLLCGFHAWSAEVMTSPRA